MIRRLRARFRIVRSPSEQARLDARLDEQDAEAARLRLRLDEAVLALDRRILDHYALTELARQEMHLRTDAIDRALSSPDGSVAELLAAEAALLDTYLIHHTETLRSDIAAARAGLGATVPEADVVVRAGDFDLCLPSADPDLIELLRLRSGDEFEPGLRAVLQRELKAGSRAVEVHAASGVHLLTMARAVGEEGELVCFEPSPRNAVSLRRTLALNGFQNRAEVRERAVAGPGATTTLDAEIPAGTSVDLVRVGAEGVAPVVWAGTERIRRDNPNVVFVVAWSASHLTNAGHAPATAMGQIRAAGFAPFAIAQGDAAGGIVALEGDAAELEGGLLLLRRA